MYFSPCGSQSDLISQLQDWFKKWWDQTPGAEEHELVYKLIREGPRDHVDRLTPSELLDWVRTWNKRLLLSFGQELPREGILCAFSCVEDTIYRLDQTELDAFVQWGSHAMGSSPQKFVDEAAKRACSEKNSRGGRLVDECFDLIDVLAALIYPWQPGRSGLRPAMMDANLRTQMDAFVTSRQGARPDRVIWLLGGAAGNMANVLRNLGLSVAVHWAYHAPELARLCPDCLQRMTLERKKDYHSAKSGIPDHPKRRSIIFSYAPGFSLRPTPQGTPHPLNLGPQKIDRQIYRYPFFTRGTRGWTRMFLQDGSGQRIRMKDQRNKILRGEGWPFIPLFGSWSANRIDFVFLAADDVLMEDVAKQFDYVILSGLQGLGDPLLNVKDPKGVDINGPARLFIQDNLRRQLSLLAETGTRLHLEISGITRVDVALGIKAIIQGVVTSAGINQEELTQITGHPAFQGSPFFYQPASPQESFVTRYERALKLAQAFELDELYIHGNDADLILVRGVPRGAMWQELMADLLAKGVVVLALLQRSVDDWQGVASELGTVLKKDGFLPLLELAAEIARRTYPGQNHDQDLLLRDIAFSGYWFNRDPDGYSCIIVPVMWPQLPADLTTAGAGDAVSAMLATLGRK